MSSCPKVLDLDGCFSSEKSGKKNEPKPKLLGPDIFRWGWGSSTWRGGGPKSSVCPSKPGKSRNFFGGISRDFAGISRRHPKSLRKKAFVFNFGPLKKPTVIMVTLFYGRVFSERALRLLLKIETIILALALGKSPPRAKKRPFSLDICILGLRYRSRLNIPIPGLVSLWAERGSDWNTILDWKFHSVFRKEPEGKKTKGKNFWKLRRTKNMFADDISADFFFSENWRYRFYWILEYFWVSSKALWKIAFFWELIGSFCSLSFCP